MMAERTWLHRAGDALQVLRGKRTMLMAASVSRDDELEGFRQVGTGINAGRKKQHDPNRDITPTELRQAVKSADYQADRNPMGRRITQIMADMTVGGITWDLGGEATDDEIALMQDFWDGNGGEVRVSKWADAVSRRGESVMPVAVDGQGRLRLGFIHPQDVDHVLYAPNTDTPSHVVLVGEESEAERTFTIVGRVEPNMDEDMDEGLRRGVPDGAEEGDYDGDVVYWAVNRAEGHGRGKPDLMAFSELLDIMDDLVFTGADRAKLALHVYWDVMLEGRSDEDIREWLDTQTAPNRGSIRAHNESVTWEMRSPELASAEVHQLFRTVKEHGLGAAGFPTTWFGTGEGANKATAGEMALPTMRMLDARRKYVVQQLLALMNYQLDLYVRFNKLTRERREKLEPNVQVPDWEDSKVAKLGAAVAQVSNAVALLTDGEYVSKRTAQRVVAVLLDQLGVDYDPDEDAGELEKDKAEKEKAMEGAAAEVVAQMRQARGETGEGASAAPSNSSMQDDDAAVA